MFILVSCKKVFVQRFQNHIVADLGFPRDENFFEASYQISTTEVPIDRVKSVVAPKTFRIFKFDLEPKIQDSKVQFYFISLHGHFVLYFTGLLEMHESNRKGKKNILYASSVIYYFNRLFSLYFIKYVLVI